jgi:serine/threonine protein kinase
MDTLKPGDQLGPYKIDALIGQGGMGSVCRATDTRLGRPVAIKVSSREFSDRFEREARAISALNHPNICTLYDVGPNYLVMELVEGQTLSTSCGKARCRLRKPCSIRSRSPTRSTRRTRGV